MFPSRTLRFIVPVLIIALLTLSPLAQTQRGPVPLPEGTWKPPSYSEQQRRVPSPVPTPNPVATWEWNVEEVIGGYWVSDTLIYRNGKMILEREHPDGVVVDRELIERPTGDRAVRKFDIEDYVWSEYFTLSATGIVRQFEWYGMQFSRSRTTFMAADAMTIGRRSQAKICIRRKLSRAATYFIQLHRELHALRRDRQFALVGFAGGSGGRWMKSFNAFHGSPGTAHMPFWKEMGFHIFDLWELAMVYVDEAGGYAISRERWESTEEREQIIAAGIAQAKCKRE